MQHQTIISGVLAATMVAGCAQKQLVEPVSAATFRVTDVVVTLEDGPARSAEFYELPVAQVAEALKAEMVPAFAAKNPTGTRAVRAEVKITRMIIANPGVGLLIGQKSSGVRGSVSIVDAQSGQALALADKVTATTKPRPTFAGSAFIRSPKGELALVAEPFARRAAIAIFGE